MEYKNYKELFQALELGFKVYSLSYHKIRSAVDQWKVPGIVQENGCLIQLRI
jgi:hypothetical protein